MQIIDTHCDALYKLQMAGRTGRRQLNYRTAEEIETNVKRLQIGGVWLQFFALFIDYRVPQHEKWNWLLEQIDLFQTEVIGKNDEIKHIKRWTQLHDLQAGDIGAVLALEGVDAIGNDL